mgnify:FL=1
MFTVCNTINSMHSILPDSGSWALWVPLETPRSTLNGLSLVHKGFKVERRATAVAPKGCLQLIGFETKLKLLRLNQALNAARTWTSDGVWATLHCHQVRT